MMVQGRVERWVITSNKQLVGELFREGENPCAFSVKVLSGEVNFCSDEEHGYVDTEEGRFILGSHKK